MVFHLEFKKQMQDTILRSELLEGAFGRSGGSFMSPF